MQCNIISTSSWKINYALQPYVLHDFQCRGVHGCIMSIYKTNLIRKWNFIILFLGTSLCSLSSPLGCFQSQQLIKIIDCFIHVESCWRDFPLAYIALAWTVYSCREWHFNVNIHGYKYALFSLLTLYSKGKDRVGSEKEELFLLSSKTVWSLIYWKKKWKWWESIRHIKIYWSKQFRWSFWKFLDQKFSKHSVALLRKLDNSIKENSQDWRMKVEKVF